MTDQLYDFTDESGVERLRATISPSPGGGSSASVGAVEPAYVTSAYDVPSPPSGAADIDGYGVADGDRVLLTGQSPSTENGLWIANTSGLWTRPSDWADGAVIPSGTLVPVGYIGNRLYSSIWQTQYAGTVGTDTLAFTCLAAGQSAFFVAPETPGDDPYMYLQTVFWGGPTADPHIVGRVWNNAGVLSVSAG